MAIIRSFCILMVGGTALVAGMTLSLVAADSGNHPAATARATTKPVALTATPEQSVRSFMHAMMLGDKELGEACSLPADGRDILWHNVASPEERIRGDAILNALPMSRFKVGDTFKLPGGSSVKFDISRVNADRQQILVKGMPIPFSVERQADGKWLVDPGAMIAARRAAAKAAGHPGAAAATPATRPAADYSSPLATFNTFVACLRADDLAGADACFHCATDLDRDYVDANMHLTIAARQLLAAVKAHMPDAARGFPEDPVDEMANLYAGAPVHIRQDTASITPGVRSPDGNQEGMPFQKIGAAWKVDGRSCFHLVSPARQAAAKEELASNRLKIRILEPIIRDINAGKIKTLAQMRARMSAPPPATAPAAR